MLWRGQRESDNVEDGRGSGGGNRLLVGGGLGGVVVVIIALLMGKDPQQLLNQVNGNAPANQSVPAARADDSMTQFVSVVLAETEDVWTDQFQKIGRTYEKPKLHLFTDYVQSGCGNASAETGPFYCPADHKVYLDMSFFNEMTNRFHAPGNFPEAYVIAHEVGHHIQNLLGVSDKVSRMEQQGSKEEANRLSVKLELQADFYAGVWANHTQKMKGLIEQGDIERALTAAAAIGDDRLQKESQGYAQPETFTHGTSAQRMYWFKRGWETGDMSKGDTFNDSSL